MKLPTLYSRTSTGAVQEWTIEIQGDSYRTHHGQTNGKIVTTEWFVAKATNVGRANERNPEEQALFEAKATWKKKKDGGSFEDVSQIDTVLFVEPMLAKKWEDRKKKVVFPVFSQPKLDGMRAVITANGANSRNGKPWLTIPHILDALEPIFKAHPDIILDGELYTHEYKHDFNKISSLIKKTKPTQADLDESADKVQFWWYDIGNKSLCFEKRTKLLNDLAKLLPEDSPIVIVPTYSARSEEELDEQYGKFMEDGYEGQMVRLNRPYEFKRSETLLKRKEFQDDEYMVVQICEGNGNKSGMAGYAWMIREDGVKFRTNIKGNHNFLRDLLVNANKYVGTYATITYFNLTPDGIPRFPYLTRLRDGKGID